MLNLIILIRCVFAFRETHDEIETNTLSFCTDYDLDKFRCLLFEGENTEDSGKIIENKKYLTDQILDLKNDKAYSTLQDWNSFVYIIKYQKSQNTDITLVCYNEFEEPSVYIKISSCFDPGSSHKFVFFKSISLSDQNILSCKLIKGQTMNNLTMIIVSDSNLGLMKSLLSLEFLSINTDLKKFVFKPMTLVYEEIIRFYKDKAVDQAKFNSFFNKASNFFTIMKEASVLRYNFLTSENLELTYFNSDNMCFDEEKLFDSKLLSIREITLKIVSAVKDILGEVQGMGINEGLLALIEEIIKFLSGFHDKYECLLKKNFDIQEKKFVQEMIKEDKIRLCFEFLNLYYNYQSLKTEVFELMCDYYVNFLHLKESRDVYDHLFSKICVKEIQLKLLKDCIEKPTIRNLTKYLTLNESQNVKIKDLQALWIKFKKYFKMLDDEITKQQGPNELLVFIKQRRSSLEEKIEYLKEDINLFMAELFYFADLHLKTNIIVYLLDNNEDVLKFKNL